MDPDRLQPFFKSFWLRSNLYDYYEGINLWHDTKLKKVDFTYYLPLRKNNLNT